MFLMRFRLSRTILVGCVATLMDTATLFLLIKGLHLSPQVANIPSLLVGSCTQFVGNRHFAFRAQGGRLRRQVLGFVGTEVIAFLLNALSFHLLVTLTTVPFVVARPLGTFAVFAAFSYPLWRRVFRTHPVEISR